MKAGTKARITAEPLDFKGYPRARAERRMRFIKDHLIVPRGHGAGEPVRLRDFQKEIIRGAFAPGVRTALISMPRANGKTALAAMLSLAEMFTGPPSAEVLVVASDHRQAGLTMKLAQRMVELNPELAERMHTYRDRLVLPENDAVLIPLPAEYDALQGYDPTLQIVDELHVVTPAVWEAVTTAAGKREESLTLAISTPSSSPDSTMWGLVEHGRSGTDPAFFLKEFAAPDGCAKDDVEAWKIANPALACERPFLAIDSMTAVMKTTREPVFRQLRLGQWVTNSEGWMPFGAWDKCADEDRQVGRERVVLAFDGSASGDSTALVGCTVDDGHHLFIEGLWENPGDQQWRVPRAEVTNAIDLAFERYDVVELACDPWGWRSEIEQWQQTHGDRVRDFNTAHAARMAPATDRLYQAVTGETVTHDGDKDLARHVAHCTAKRTPAGDLVSKDKKSSPRKIDAAVAAIVALDRAAFYSQRRKSRVAGFRN